jgi:hypothetical protein
MLTVWLDPGLLTGVCIVDARSGDLLYLDEHDLFHTMQPLEELAGFQAVSVGWESYTILKGPQGQAPWSLEVIGAAKYVCQRNGYTVLTAAAPSARLVTKDTMLKAMGWYPKIVGKKDAKSAAMHTVAWWLRTDTLPDQYRNAVYGSIE